MGVSVVSVSKLVTLSLWYSVEEFTRGLLSVCGWSVCGVGGVGGEGRESPLWSVPSRRSVVGVGRMI